MLVNRISWHVLPGDEVKTEAWVLRNMVSILAGAARRPHIPRSHEFRELFKALGISLPSKDQQADATVDEGTLE